MHRDIPPFPQYAFMAWYSVKAQGQLYLTLWMQQCQMAFPCVRNVVISLLICPVTLEVGQRWDLLSVPLDVWSSEFRWQTTGRNHLHFLCIFLLRYFRPLTFSVDSPKSPTYDTNLAENQLLPCLGKSSLVLVCIQMLRNSFVSARNVQISSRHTYHSTKLFS
jgi:hypothetical protein